jgi:flagellar protein FlaG
MPKEANAITAVPPPAPAFNVSAGPRHHEPRQQPDPAPDLRLVIEQGPKRGSFVYKTVDRLTGETIRQFPREELVKLIADPAYVAGTVANTTA